MNKQSDWKHFKVTKHAEVRSRERLGINKKAVNRNAEKALKFGISHKETRGSLKRYISSLFLTYGNGNNMRVYHRYVYIFNGRVLITVLELPKKYYDVYEKLQKEKDESNIKNIESSE